MYPSGSSESEGSVTLKAVTKTDQGFYMCHHPIAGRTNDLWITVKSTEKHTGAIPLTRQNSQLNLKMSLKGSDESMMPSSQLLADGQWQQILCVCVCV